MSILNFIKNNPVTNKNIDLAKSIFGEDIRTLIRKLTRKKQKNYFRPH